MSENKNMTTESASTRMGVPLERLVRRFPVDWKAIAAESGCTHGTLCCHPSLGWGVMDGNGDADFCCVTPPTVADGELLRIEGSEWAVYAPNIKPSGGLPSAQANGLAGGPDA